MESAIPPHLQVSRSRHRRVPDDYQPPYPSFVARHRPEVGSVVMAYFGVQYSGGHAQRLASGAEVARRLHSLRPTGRVTGTALPMSTKLVIATRSRSPIGMIGPHSMSGFRERARPGPASRPLVSANSSRFCSPSVNNYETLFSSLGRPEGVAVVADGMSGEVLEHAYWGGMRDRIPLSQTNEMAAVGVPAVAARRPEPAGEAA